MTGREMNPVTREQPPPFAVQDERAVVGERVERSWNEPGAKGKRASDEREPRETAKLGLVDWWGVGGHPGGFGLAKRAGRGT